MVLSREQRAEGRGQQRAKGIEKKFYKNVKKIIFQVTF